MVTGHWEDEGLLGDEDYRRMCRDNLLEEIRIWRQETALGYTDGIALHQDWIAEELEALGGLAGTW